MTLLPTQNEDSRTRFVLEEAGRRVANFGTLVKERRLAGGMTVTRLAELTGVGRRFVHELESGKDTVQLGRALLVAEAVGIDLVAAMRSFLDGHREQPRPGYDDDELPQPDEPEDEGPGFGR